MLKKIFAVVMAILTISMNAMAYNVIDIPMSMTFADALGIYDVSEIESATICDLEHNTYRNLTSEEIKDFYYAASNVTVWRKVNPTPFRGVCVNFNTRSGNNISYFYNSGIQIGTYGAYNYICYMPAAQDTAALSYLASQFYDSIGGEGVYGGVMKNTALANDFLKLPSAQWAQNEVVEAASKSLVPYEFTDKYESSITREQMAVLLANLITVAGNYASIDKYLEDKGVTYQPDRFVDCLYNDPSIVKLNALGIINGKDDTHFDPSGRITRQEAAAMFTRVADKFVYVSSEKAISAADKSKVADWAVFSMMWCMDKGILSVDAQNNVNPTEYMSVQQAITCVSRIYDIVTAWSF